MGIASFCSHQGDNRHHQDVCLFRYGDGFGCMFGCDGSRVSQSVSYFTVRRGERGAGVGSVLEVPFGDSREVL